MNKVITSQKKNNCNIIFHFYYGIIILMFHFSYFLKYILFENEKIKEKYFNILKVLSEFYYKVNEKNKFM